MRWIVGKLLRITTWALAIVWLAYTAVYYGLNDARLGAFISARVNKVDRGSFLIAYTHYDYWGGLLSILFNTRTRAVGEDFTLRDPEGHLVIEVPTVDTDVRLQQLVVSLAKYAATGRFHLDLHFVGAHVPDALAVIGPLRGTAEVNIVAAMSARNPAPPGAAGEFRITVDDLTVDRVRFGIGFRNPTTGAPSWSGKITGRAQAGLVYSSARSLATSAGPYFFFKVKATAPEGELRLGRYRFPLEQIADADFGPDGDRREDLVFHGRARTLGAPVRIEGALTRAYSLEPGVRLTLGFEHAAQLYAFLPPPLDQWLGGDPHGTLSVNGPFSGVVIQGEATGARATVKEVEVSDLAAKFKLERGVLTVEPEGRAADGHVSGRFDMALALPLWWRARLHVRGLDPKEVPLPRRWQAQLAGRLDARVRLAGHFAPDAPITVEIEESSLERTRGGGLPRRFTLTGAGEWLAPRMRLKDAKLEADGLALSATGTVDTDSRELDADLRLDSGHGAAWLGRIGVPSSVRLGEAHLRGTLSGTLLRPVVRGRLAANDLSVAGRNFESLEADVDFYRGALTFSGLRGAGLGASVQGSAAVQLFEGGDLSRPLAEPTVSAALRARGVAMQSLAGWPGLDGIGEVSLDVDGKWSDPHGHARFSLPQLTLRGDTYENGLVEVDLGQGGAQVRTARLERRAGGSLAGHGRIGWDRTYDLTLTPHRFPIPAIPGVASLPVPLDGSLGGSVRLVGTWDNPQLEGELSLYRFNFRSSPLGDGSLKWLPGGDATAILGRFFGDQFAVDGYVTLLPKATVVATVRFSDFALEKLVPELRSLAEMHGVATGEVRLSFSVDAGFFAELRLPKLEIALASTDEEGRVQKAVLKNQGDVRVASDGLSMRIQRADFVSPLGDFHVLGRVGAQDSDVRFKGYTKLELLEYFFRGAFNHTHGAAYVDLRVQGNPQRPDLTGFIELRSSKDGVAVRIEPRGMESYLTVPSGRVDFTPTSVALTNLAFTMDNATAQASGSVELDRWKPGRIQGHLTGELSPNLLRFVTDQISEASGRIAVDVNIGGRWTEPDWEGKARISQRVVGQLRNFPQEIAISEGTLGFDNHRITLGGVVAAIEDRRVDGSGWISLTEGPALDRIELHLAGSELKYSNAIYAVTFTPNVILTGDHDNLALSGNIVVTDGRYVQQWGDPKDFIIQPRVVEKTTPFWEGNPLLETLALKDLKIRSAGQLVLKNNYLDMRASAELSVSGTLSDPRVDGSISVEAGGRVNLPLVRYPFEINQSAISFSHEKRIPDDNPTVQVTATATMVDQYDNSHNIELGLTGTLAHLQLTLQATAEGWDKKDCASALVTGRTPDQVRQQYFPSSSGGGGGAIGNSAGDAIAKSVTGIGIGTVLSEPLQKTFKLDTAVFEFSAGSVDVRLCKKSGRFLKVCGYGELGFAGSSRAQGSVQVRASDNLSGNFSLEYLPQNYGLGTLQDNISRFRFELKLQIPLGY